MTTRTFLAFGYAVFLLAALSHRIATLIAEASDFFAEDAAN